MDRTSPPLGHPGEIAARRRFSNGDEPGDEAVARMRRRSLPAPWVAFIEAQPFFFTATSDGGGRCDAGYRGRDYDLSGRAQPLLKVLDPARLVFPDFSGNGMFSALGNILINPHIGLLFIDFHAIRRLRVNGRAEVLDDSDLVRGIWPGTGRGVLVTVEEAFANCSARIPRMAVIDPDPWEI